MYAGLAILLVLLFEAASGWLLWTAAHRRAWLAAAFLEALPTELPRLPFGRWLLDVPTVTDGHVWIGYLLVGLTLVKLGAVWWLLRLWAPRRLGRARLIFEKLMAWSLPLVYGMVLLTGVALDQRFGLAWGRAGVRDLHLWSSELAGPVTVWHLVRYLPTAWRVAVRDLGAGRARGPVVQG